MFKRHALQVKMVKTNHKQNALEPTVACTHIDPELISKIVKENVKHTAIVIVAVVASVVVLNTASEIVINASPKN